jgi:ABC-type lipoprotein release transport system permease subunit
MASIWQDIRFGLRMLRHGKGVTGAAATLFVSTMAAGLLPAWRATRYDPATILRRE